MRCTGVSLATSVPLLLLAFSCGLPLRSVAANNDVFRSNNIRQRKVTAVVEEADEDPYPDPPRGPAQVGDAISTNIGPSDSAVPPVETNKLNELTYEIQFRPGAPYTTVHFSQFDMGDLCQMVVTGKDLSDGRPQKYRMSGKGKMQLGQFWTQHVKGDTMWLSIICPEGLNAAAETTFQIDEVAVGFLSNDDMPEERGYFPESLCGTSDFRNAVCLFGTEQYERAKAIARLLVDGTGWCTGWLVSGSNHLITNEHCITSQAQANNIDFEFGAEAPTCQSPNCPNCHPGTVYSGSTFIRDNTALDYALLQLNEDPASTYGFLEVDDRKPEVGERIYIVQHPARRAKEVSISSSHPDDNGNCLIHSTTMRGCVADIEEVGYYCDTEGGSSGSPVLSYWSNKVIALHHCGGCLNLAVPMHRIWKEIASTVTGSPAPTPSPGAPTPQVPTAPTPPVTDGGGGLFFCFTWDNIAASIASLFSFGN